jgi:serine/threonine protein phosphatase PrpC
VQSVSFDKRDKSHLNYVNLNNNNNNNSNNTSLSPLIKGKRNNKPINHSNHCHSLNNNSNSKSAYISCSENKYKSTLLKYSCKSKAGHNITGAIKINQDNCLVKNRIFGYTNFSIFAVFDGHGINGHCVSQFLKEHFSTFFTTKDSFFTSIPQQQQHNPLFTEKHIHDKLTNINFIKQMCSTADERLRKQKFDSKLSGSTGVIVVHIEDKLICYNIGDSRAIYINSNYEPIQITRDHKPNLPEEQKRILNAGGRVAKIQHIANIGPYRVWLKKEDVPGLAMSRSFGDFIAKSVGVINEPDVFEIAITECKVKAVIIASDGLWEFVSNDTIADIVVPFIVNKDCNGATKKLVDEAFKAWTKDGGVVCDDITIIVVMFDIQE